MSYKLNSEHMTALKDKFKRICVFAYICELFLVGQAPFGDGAAALIVGADPDVSIECPLFELVSATQTIIPDSEGSIEAHIVEAGQTFHLLKEVPSLIAVNIESCLTEAFAPLGISDWNSVFWVPHPGGSKILNRIESELGLKEEKLRISRYILSEYGNLSSVCVFFILDEMRKESAAEEKATTGEGMEWAVLFGFGPGLTIETVVLQSVSIS